MKNEDTIYHYSLIGKKCLDLFLKKTHDYGTSWRVLRPISVIDQIYIKLQRIKTIQDNKSQKIEDNLQTEFVGIINYSIIGLIQLALKDQTKEDLSAYEAEQQYQHNFERAKALMLLKNHDYGEAWRNLSEISFVDLMLMKIYRMRQIISHQGKTLVSEGLDANYLDIINYAIFVQILFYNDEK